MNSLSTSDSSVASQRSAPGDRETLRQRVESLRIAKSAPPRRSGWSILLWTFSLAVAGVGAAGAGYLFGRPDPDKAAEPAALKTLVASTSQPVAAQPAARGGLVLESKGYIIPAKQVLVSPKVSGMIMKLNVVEGQRVAQGDVLAELEDTDYQADFARATATLEAAKQRCQELQGYRPEEIDQAHAELSEAQAQLDQYEDDWRRAATLSDAKALSTEVRDAAESKLRATEQRVRRLTLAVALMEKGPREERKKAAEADVQSGRSRTGQGPVATRQLHDPRPDLRHDPPQERGGGQHRQSDRLQRQLQPVRDGRPVRPGGRTEHRRSETSRKCSAGQKCKIRAEAFPDRVYDGVVARTDADCRSSERSDPGARQDLHSAGGRRGLSQAGNGGLRIVPGDRAGGSRPRPGDGQPEPKRNRPANRTRSAAALLDRATALPPFRKLSRPHG